MITRYANAKTPAKVDNMYNVRFLVSMNTRYAGLLLLYIMISRANSKKVDMLTEASKQALRQTTYSLVKTTSRSATAPSPDPRQRAGNVVDRHVIILALGNHRNIVVSRYGSNLGVITSTLRRGHRGNLAVRTLQLLQQLLRNLRARLRRETQLGALAPVILIHLTTLENDKLGLEEDITVNRKGEALGTLQAAVAPLGAGKVVGIGRRVLDQVTGETSLVRADVQDQIGQLGVAREDVAAVVVVGAGLGDLGVVSVDDGLREHEQGGTGVGDGGVGHGLEDAGFVVGLEAGDVGGGQGEAADFELPETAGGVDFYKRNRADELGGVDEAEVVVARLGLIEIGRKQRHGEVVDGIAEEGLLLARVDLVDGVEGETDEAGGGGVVGEGVGDIGGRLDGLLLHLDATDADLVEVHIAGRAATVTVRDPPDVAVDALGGAALGDVVDLLTLALLSGGLGAEHPEIGRAGVEVQHDRLRRGTDLDGGEILNIELDRRSLNLTCKGC